MRAVTQHQKSDDYDSLPYYILNNKNQTVTDAYRYREWLFNAKIESPPLLNLPTKTNSQQVSSTNNLAQLLKGAGGTGDADLWCTYR
jgi:hypothetical protein